MKKKTKRHTITTSKYSWVVSVLFHIVLLSVLGIIQFSRAKLVESHNSPEASIRTIEEIINSEQVMPKPKVKSSLYTNVTTRPERIEVSDLKDIANETKIDLSVVDDEMDIDEEIFSESLDGISADFFGAKVSGRKICYVIDCSGSMLGVFGNVREEVRRSISKLEPDVYFSLVIFGGKSVWESGEGSLKRATPDNKQAAINMINSTLPGGSSDAAGAIKRAMHIRGPMGESCTDIFFLTDGFELNGQDNAIFLGQLVSLRKEVAPRIKINTIGFWSEVSQVSLLKEIATVTDGKFIKISEKD